MWSRKKLTQMLYHSFIGTIADNIIEIGWILCFSLLADKQLVELITTMFGLNDALWVILSSTYYTTRTALVSRMPKLIEETKKRTNLQPAIRSIEQQQLKTAIWLFYIMLLPMTVGTFVYMPRLLTLLGVTNTDLPLYLP